MAIEATLSPDSAYGLGQQVADHLSLVLRNVHPGVREIFDEWLKHFIEVDYPAEWYAGFVAGASRNQVVAMHYAEHFATLKGGTQVLMTRTGRPRHYATEVAALTVSDALRAVGMNTSVLRNGNVFFVQVHPVEPRA